MSWWLVTAVVVVTVTGIAAAVYYNHLRSKKILAYATEHRLNYSKRDDRWAQLDLGWPAGLGHSHRAKNVLTGAYDGRPFACFEHTWVTSDGKNSTTYTARVVAVGLPRSFPKLEIREEGLLGRAARRMGIKDIELESEQFNQQYHVGGDRRFAYDVLSPRLMQWMLDQRAAGFTINGDWLAFAEWGRIDVDAIESSLRYVDTIADQLPAFVING